MCRGGGPFLRVEVRVGAQLNFIPRPRQTFSQNEACQDAVRGARATACRLPCRGRHLSHIPRDPTHSRSRTLHGCAAHNTHSRTMNSLYTLGVRQSSSIQADLERMRGGDTSASLLGLSPPLTCSDLVTAHSGILYPARADICFARRNEPHDRRL
jgi:hypothetical protein